MRDRATVDLRSDTVTRPTPGMLRAMVEAEVGDMVLGDDPAVARLEAHMAALLGMERALFLPSGIMANQVALLVLAPPGTEAVIDGGGHIVQYEEAAAAALGGIQLRTVATESGLLDAAAVRESIRPESPYVVQTSVVCLENTHNSGGGRVLSVAAMREVVAVARERGVAVHLDGARLPNAAVAAGEEMRAWAAQADTVMVSFTKGLGAPVGSVLAGSAVLMERAVRLRRRLGGGMRQAGLLAAAAMYGLEHHFAGLADDHRRAARLAGMAGEIDGVTVVAPETNIVMLDLLRADPAFLIERMEAAGVRMTRFGARRLRAVLHRDVDDADVERAAEVLATAVTRS